MQHVAAINDPTFVLQQLPTVLKMHGQWLIVLLAGLFPSARGFGSVCSMDMFKDGGAPPGWFMSKCPVSCKLCG